MRLQPCVREIIEYYERLDWLKKLRITNRDKVIGLMVDEFPELDQAGTREVIRLYERGVK